MTKIFNKTSEKEIRKSLRKNMPNAEIILWSRLKGKKLNGYKFRRQYSIKRFIVDFYCPELKLAIEIDGDSHFMEGSKEKDKLRMECIKSYGISFLRFTNNDVYENLDEVLGKILEYLPVKEQF